MSSGSVVTMVWPSRANTRSLDRALEDLENAKRGAEYLIRGTVPAEYVTVVSYLGGGFL